MVGRQQQYAQGIGTCEKVLRNPSDDETLLEMMRQIINIVMAIHEAGYVHNDLRASNFGGIGTYYERHAAGFRIADKSRQEKR